MRRLGWLRLRVVVLLMAGLREKHPASSRTTIEKGSESLGIDGSRHDNDSQVGPQRFDAPKDSKEHVCLQRALVSLVHDHARVCAQQGIGLSLSKEQAVGDILDTRNSGCLCLCEAHGKAYLFAELHAPLLRYAGCQHRCSHPSGLRAADASSVRCPSRLEQVLRHLRTLAASSFRRDDHYVKSFHRK
jgi:hypothetical protein